ncbi:MAG: hypothetical protein Q4G29_00175 [Pseudoscardovia radai]|nr:hypothetical protein [Pseudoscardovia radai]
MRLVAAVVVVVLVLVAGTATFLGMHRMLPWQSVPVPSLDQIAGKQGATVDSLTADQVEAELRSEGFRTTRSQQYSGKSAGAFLAFSNVSEGQQLRHGDLIDIVESLGPGVPSGTVGAKATDSKQTLAGMNVPVTYRAVYTAGGQVTDSSGSARTLTDGMVAATYPADGQPVTDIGAGITVAVATTQGTGIPVDYYGQDPAVVQADLASRGYTVAWEPRFATKANIGKIVGSDPALGSAAAAGTSVTLYYGVDSSTAQGMHDDALAMNSDGILISDLTAAAGLYCKADGSDCITLSEDCGQRSCVLVSSQTGPADVSGMTELVPCFFAQGTCMYNPDTTTSLGTDRAPYWEGSPLLFGDTGTFELTTWRQVVYGYCGTSGDWKYWKQETVSGGDSMQVCVDGQIRDAYHMDISHDVDDPGYQMDDAWYVYVPVGADIKAVEDMGYFDADAMSQAASQGEPDSGTPYLIARDPSLYTDQQRRQYKHDVFPDLASVDMTTNVNPSIAFLGNHARYAVKPAPSAQSAYYLVENPLAQQRLGVFAEANIDGTASSDSESSPGPSELPSSASGDSSSPQESTATPQKRYTSEEAVASIHQGDFTPVAGTYCSYDSPQFPNRCVTITETGMISGTGNAMEEQRGSQQLGADAQGAEGTVLLEAPMSYWKCIGDDGVAHPAAFEDCDLAHAVPSYTVTIYLDPGKEDWGSWGYPSNPRDIPFLTELQDEREMEFSHTFEDCFYKME